MPDIHVHHKVGESVPVRDLLGSETPARSSCNLNPTPSSPRNPDCREGICRCTSIPSFHACFTFGGSENASAWYLEKAVSHTASAALLTTRRRPGTTDSEDLSGKLERSIGQPELTQGSRVAPLEVTRRSPYTAGSARHGTLSCTAGLPQ